MTGKERRAGIRKLKEVVEQEIRLELKAAREDSEFADERTFLWDPSAAICHRLEIAPAALSRLMKELTGMSVTQMVDKIRAAGVRGKLSKELRAFVERGLGKPGRATHTLEEFRGIVREQRRAAGFNLATWAISLGFSSYSRFYRACLLAHGQTPMQMEEEILRALMEWHNAASLLNDRVKALDAAGIVPLTGKSWGRWRRRMMGTGTVNGQRRMRRRVGGRWKGVRG